MSVTQGAVSRQIRQLEEFLGRALFSRENRQVFLTDDGHNYFVSIAHVLEQLGTVTDALLAPAHPHQVTIATSSALASMYLLPRIPHFRRHHPQIQIRIIARESLDGLAPSEYDLALYYGRSEPVNGRPIPLFGEKVFPVCSPEYHKASQWQFKDNQFQPDNLIWLESLEDWINWPEWLEAMQIKLPSSAGQLLVNNYNMVIQAAVDSQGVALAWSQFIDRELKAGALIRPCDHVLETRARFYLMESPAMEVRDQTEVLRKWLVAQADLSEPI